VHLQIFIRKHDQLWTNKRYVTDADLVSYYFLEKTLTTIGFPLLHFIDNNSDKYSRGQWGLPSKQIP
jgi:hypothetical protein